MKCQKCGVALAPFETADIEGVFGDILRRSAAAPRDCPACYETQRAKNWEALCVANWRSIAPESVQCANDGRFSGIAPFMKAFPASMKGKRNLFFVGPCRSGKTFAAWRCVLAARINGKGAEFIMGADFAFSLRDFSVDIPAMIDRLASADILLIDDFGKIDWTAKGVPALVFSVINRRTEAQKVTVFTANTSIERLRTSCETGAPTYAEPIFSRIEESLEVAVLK